MLRNVLRHYALSALAEGYLLTGKMHALHRKRVQFMYLHDVLPHEEPAFRRLLTALGRDHSFIDYNEAVRRVLSGDIDKPYLCISFDDGFKRCMDIADVLDEFDIKGCFFVCPSVVDEKRASVVEDFCATRLHVQPTEFLSWNDVERLIKRGHCIGGHSMTHPNLAELPADQLHDEIGTCYEHLRQAIGPVTHFAWPYGLFRHFSARAASTVFEAGFRTCASAERGCHVAAAQHRERLCIRRDNTVSTWPLNHVNYLMARNSRRATESDNYWPATWWQEVPALMPHADRGL